MIGVLFTIAAGVGIATYFLYFERDEAEVINITWHHQCHNNITTTSIHKIQIWSIATFMKNCSDPAGEDADGDGEGADDG